MPEPVKAIAHYRTFEYFRKQDVTNFLKVGILTPVEVESFFTTAISHDIKNYD